MNGINNQVNGLNGPYTLLKPNENIETSTVPWVERFVTFYQRVGFEPGWIIENNGPANNGATFTARVTVNGHMLDVVGQGRSHKEARARLVRRLEEVHHDILHIPLLPQFANPPTNEDALANGDPAQADGNPAQVDGNPVQIDGVPAQVNNGPAQANGDLTQADGA